MVEINESGIIGSIDKLTPQQRAGLTEVHVVEENFPNNESLAGKNLNSKGITDSDKSVIDQSHQIENAVSISEGVGKKSTDQNTQTSLLNKLIRGEVNIDKLDVNSGNASEILDGLLDKR